VPQVIDGALWILSRLPHIKFPPVTTGLSVEAKLLDRLSDMLEHSSTTEQSYWIIEIVSHLARDKSTAIIVAEGNILNSLKKHLRSLPTDQYYQLMWKMTPILESLASHKSTAMAILHMIPLDLFSTRLRYVTIDLHIFSEVYKLIQSKYR
jgi:hypothetical protein